MLDAVQVSLDAGFDGILVFKAKTSDLLDYYAGRLVLGGPRRMTRFG